MSQCTCADPQAVVQAINQSSEKVSEQIDKSSTQLDETMYGKSLDPAGQHGAPAPARFCNWAAPEYGDIGENGWTMAFRAATIAIALANGLAQAEISAKQQDLADGYYQQAKFKWDRFQGNYMPLEVAMLNEASSEPLRYLNCEDDRNRSRAAVDTAYDAAERYLGQMAKKLRVCVDSSLLNMVNQKQVLSYSDTANYNIRDDEFFTDYKNDQRWNRRSNLLNLGRNLGSEAMKYGDVARALYGQVGAQIDRAASGLISALGYYGTRNDTVYPSTYLSGSGSQNPGLVTIQPPTNINPVAQAGYNAP